MSIEPRQEILLLLASMPPLPLGRTVLEQPLGVELIGVASGDKRMLPAFTSQVTLLLWRPQGGPFIGVEARVAAQLALQHGYDGLVIDAGQPDEATYAGDGLRELAES